MAQDQQQKDSLQESLANADVCANASASSDGTTTQKRGLRASEIVLIIVAVLAVICAIVGFVLFAGASVPSDAAAKINDEYLAESEVSEYIDQYRIAYGIDDDDAFAALLSSQGMSVSQFRINIIDTLATNMLIEKRAEELGAVPTEAEIQAEVDAAKQGYAFGDEDTWDETLKSYALTEDGLYDQYRINLEKAALLAEDVPYREATDEEILSYATYYLADTTQKHIYRIMFAGDDAHDRANECLDELKSIQEAGNLNTDTFSEVARERSDEADVEQTGGSYAWTGDGVMDSDVYEIVEYLNAGDMTGLESIDGDDVIEILYCDETYTFPSSDEIDELTTEDIPETLLVTISNAASDELWSADCDAYLAQLLADAKVTYYPVPADAPYNVDVSAVS